MSSTWTADTDRIPGIGSALLASLIVFTYMVLRLIEARQAHFLIQQTEGSIDMEKQDTKSRRILHQEDDIDFGELEDAFFQLERTKRPTLGTKANIRIFTQALATVAFSCHTSSSLPISLIGIMVSSGLIFCCLWEKQLNYEWLSDLAIYHLHGTLFFIVCASTTAVTMMVWSYDQDQPYPDKVLLDGYLWVLKFLGIFTSVFAGCLLLFWMYKRHRSYVRRKALSMQPGI